MQCARPGPIFRFWGLATFYDRKRNATRKRSERETERERQREEACEREGTSDLWLCQKLPKVCAKMHKIAKQRGTDGGIDKIEEVRKGGRGRGMVESGTWTSGGLEQSNSQTAAEMYNKSRRQRATSTKNATLRIRSGAPPKKPNNRTKPRTLDRIPSPLPSTAFFSLSNPLSLRGLSLSALSMLNGF